MMMVDEEDVPMLIDARDVKDEEPNSRFNTLQRRDTDATRVPLTIITGMSKRAICVFLFT